MHGSSARSGPSSRSRTAASTVAPPTAAVSSVARDGAGKRPIRASTASSTLWGTAPRAPGDELGDEEGVAPRAPVKLARVETAPLGQRADRIDREGLHPDTPERARGRHIPERDPQRVPRADLVVPERHHHQGTGRFDPPREESQEVDGGGVGPVRILDDQQRGLDPAQLGEHRAEQRLPSGVALEQPCEAGLHGGDVPEGAERPRGGQRIAASDEHPPGRDTGSEKRPHQAGLPCPGLAADQCQDAPSRRGLGPRLGQRSQRTLALEQQHRGTERTPGSPGLRSSARPPRQGAARG